jgi:hypothetical protein
VPNAAVIVAVVSLAALVASDTSLARPQIRPGMPARPAFALGAPPQEEPAVHTSLLARASLCVAGRRLGSYGWPVKPFDRQHPIRAFFGDPRTVFRAADDASLGAFSFHNGVDIVAADGTPVYPVLTGIVSRVKPDEIVVSTHVGLRLRVFQYWHLVSMVRLHQQVQAQRTVLGTVQPGRGHVHLTEIDGPVVENPLQPGHLTPYQDNTPPSVEDLSFRDRTGHRLNPEALTGSVDITAAAADTPPLPLPAPWTGVPVTPARVSWQLRTRSGRHLLPEQTPADFLITIPPPDRFWSVYADGTYQNFPTVGTHYFYGTHGDYLFNLTPSPLDTRLLPPGRYQLTVVAADTCGNRGTLTEQIRILPQPPATPLTGTILQRLTQQHPTNRPRPPRRFWTVTIATLPATQRLSPSQAVDGYTLDTHLARIGLLATSTRSGTRSGNKIIFAGYYHSWARAYTAAQTAAPLFPTARPREIVQRQRAPKGKSLLALTNFERGRGRYTVVLASLPARAASDAAHALLTASSRGLPSVRLILSSHFQGLQPGYIVIVSGHYPTGEAATHAAHLDAKHYHHCYARKLVPKTAHG